MFEDGSIVRGTIVDGQGVVEILPPNDEPMRRITVGEAARIVTRGEVQKGVITVSTTMNDEDWSLDKPWTSYAVDVTSGSVERIDGVGRGAMPWWWVGSLTQHPIVNRIFQGDDGTLLIWDPETGEVKPLFEKNR
jgi:hypothetical protein